jgi:hypothetical protein
MTQKTDDSFLVFIVPDSLVTDGVVKEDLVIASEQPTSLLEKESDQQAVAVTPADDGFENINTRRERVQTQDAKAAISASKTTTPATSGGSTSPPPAAAKESETGNLAASDAVQEQIATEKKDAGYYANQMDPSVMSKRVSGYVTDELGQPLIGANLQIRNTNLGTISDLGGKFELFLPAPESVIDVSYVYLKGVRFLLATQRSDGSWHVSSRATKFQIYFESGFPHGPDQWISTMGTGWAAAALALAIDGK